MSSQLVLVLDRHDGKGMVSPSPICICQLPISVPYHYRSHKITHYFLLVEPVSVF